MKIYEFAFIVNLTLVFEQKIIKKDIDNTVFINYFSLVLI
jgi:hypothetical protein